MAKKAKTGKENPRLKKVKPNNYSRPEIDKIRLGEVVEIFNNMDTHAQGEGIDLFGRVYEYCLQNFAAETQSSGGEFNANTWKMAHMNLAIRGLEAGIREKLAGIGFSVKEA